MRTFAAPAVLCAFGLLAAMAAVLQFSLRAYVPGSLDPGGFTLANFTDLLKPLYARVFLDTVLDMLSDRSLDADRRLSRWPTRWFASQNAIVKSILLVIVVTPLFLGEVVRTYSWIIVLGNNGFINSVLLNLGIIQQPIQFMFTTFGVVVALVHVTMPVMVIMLAAALVAHRPGLPAAAESLGAGPVRVFLTVTLPLSMPGVVAGVTTAFAWTFSAFATPQLIGGGRVNMISNLVYQLGFASFNFPFAASLCVAGLALTIVVLSMLRLASRRLENDRAALRCRARPISACSDSSANSSFC